VFKQLLEGWSEYQRQRSHQRFYRYLQELIDDAAFPIHLMCTISGLEPPGGRLKWAGRVLTQGEFAARDPELGEVAETIRRWGLLYSADVLHMPRYYGTLIQAPPLPERLLDDYAASMRTLKALAPHVGGILIGNQGPELGYRHITNDPLQSIHLTCEFIKRIAEIVREAGYIPFFAPMDWDIIADCYQAGWKMLETLDDVEATTICFCGFSMFFDAYCDRKQPLMCNQLKVIQGFEGQDEPAILMEYIQQGNFWTGINGRDGLIHGNDRVLTAAGFKAGIAGGWGLGTSDVAGCWTARADARR